MINNSNITSTPAETRYSETRKGIHDWDFTALSRKMREKGIYIPTESDGRAKKTAFVLLISGKPYKIISTGCWHYQDAQQTAIGILYGAKQFKKSASVCVYVWGSDNCWHLAEARETYYAYTPNIVNNSNLLNSNKGWNIDEATLPNY